MTTIYKYPIRITDEQQIEMPSTRKFLHAGLDLSRRPCIWVLVDTGSPVTKATIRVAGTGNELGLDFFGRTFVGTFTMDVFAWHVFA